MSNQNLRWSDSENSIPLSAKIPALVTTSPIRFGFSFTAAGAAAFELLTTGAGTEDAGFTDLITRRTILLSLRFARTGIDGTGFGTGAGSGFFR